MIGCSLVRRRITCQTLVVALMLLGLTVVATPQAHAVADAVVSGTVVDSLTAQPLASVTVTDSTSGRSTTTAAPGAYSLSLPPGDHVLTATLAGYVPASTPKLTLTAGQVLTAQGFTLSKYASASGTLTEQGTGGSIAGAVAKFFDASTSDPNPEFAATVGPDGSWSLPQIAPGTYKVLFDTAGTDFAYRWFGGTLTEDLATAVTLVPAEHRSVSATLPRLSRFTGHVRAEYPSLQPLVGATVTATSKTDVTTKAVSDQNGDFVVAGLVDGSYQVRVTAPGYAPTWVPRMSASTAFPYDLSAGAVTDLSYLYLSPGSTVTGTIHLPPGQSALVVARPDFDEASTTTDANGRFTLTDIGIVDRVFVYAWGYDPLTVSFSLSPGGSVSVEATPVLSTQPPVTARGRIVDTKGVPVSGATASYQTLKTAVSGPDGTFSLPVLVTNGATEIKVTAPGFLSVTVQSATPSAWGDIVLHRASTASGRVTVAPGNASASYALVQLTSRGGSDGEWVRANADGVYTVSGLTPGYYLARASLQTAAGTISGFSGGATSLTLASFIWVGEGTDVTGVDLNVYRTGKLSGVIHDRRPVYPLARAFLTGAGGTVFAYTSDWDGSFQIVGIPPGTYRLSAENENRVTWWAGSAEMGGATEITIQADDDLTGYVVSMPTLYRVSGTVRTTAGAAVRNVTITAMDSTGTKYRPSTNDTGGYIVDLPPGSYEFGVENGSGGVSWPVPSDVLTVGSDLVKDLTAPDMRVTKLTVRGSDGSIPPLFTAVAFNVRGERYQAAASTEGSANILLPDGTFTLEFSATGYLAQSIQATVTSSAEISVVLDVGGRIAGSVAGAPATVTAINVSTGQRFDLTTLTGGYLLSGLPSGEYVVTAGPVDDTSWHSGCGWATWYGGSTYSNARRIHVGSGVSASGVDLEVHCSPSWVSGGRITARAVLPVSAPANAVDGLSIVARDASGRLFAVVAGTNAAFDQLPAGTYTVTAVQADLGLEAHAAVIVESGNVTDVTLVLAQRGRVSGRLVGPNGEPVAGLIRLGDLTAGSGADGNFSLSPVPYGTHSLKVDFDDLFVRVLYGTAFTEVTVGPGSDVVGLVIHVPLGATLTGTLPSNTVVEVTLSDTAGHVVASRSFTQFYRFFGVPPGPTYIRFSGADIVAEWWRDASDRASAAPVVIADGGGLVDATPNLSPAVGTESITFITGTVTSSAGPFPGVLISTSVVMRTPLGWETVATATTANDGTYSLAVPRGDSYLVSATICLGPTTSPCTGQDYAGTRSVAAEGSSVTGVDFTIPDSLPPFITTSAPTITGLPRVGETLTASVGNWTPVQESTSWQWYGDGVAIAGATTASLTLDEALVGHRISVLATGNRTGYSHPAMMSVSTDPVEVPGAIHALTPSRLLDSRTGLGGFTGPATNGTVIKLPVWGIGGVPTGASAVLVNITVTQPTASGFLTAYASGGTAPWVSNANFTPGTTAANLSLVPVGADGAIAIKASLFGSVHVIADVQGYVVGGAVTAAGGVVPVTPSRVLDTRTTQHVGAGGTVTFAVAGVAGVKPDASAVVANITVTGPTGPGYLTAWPAGVARPTSSNVNFVTNQTVPNLAIVKIGTNKSISIFNSTSGALDIVVDIQGYVTAGTATLPGTVVPVTPTRVVDTRLNKGATGPVPANTGRTGDFSSPDLSTPPQGALINLTVTDPKASGWLAAYPAGVARPLVSNLNFNAGMVVPNLSLVTLNAAKGTLYSGSGGTVQMVADVLAYVL